MTSTRNTATLLLGAGMLSLWITTIHAQTAPYTTDPQVIQNQDYLIVTTIIGFLSLIATQIFALLRERRNRQWDLQDRADARAEAAKRAEIQRLETISTAVQLARVSKMHQASLIEEIQKNTELTHQVSQKADAAYEAGNNFNEKLDRLHRELYGKHGQIDHIETVAEDIDNKVTELQQSAGLTPEKDSSQ